MTVLEALKWAVLKNLGQVVEVKICGTDLCREIGAVYVVNEKLQRTSVKVDIVAEPVYGQYETTRLVAEAHREAFEGVAQLPYKCSIGFSNWLAHHEVKQRFALIPATIMIDHRNQSVRLMGE